MKKLKYIMCPLLIFILFIGCTLSVYAQDITEPNPNYSQTDYSEDGALAQIGQYITGQILTESAWLQIERDTKEKLAQDYNNQTEYDNFDDYLNSLIREDQRVTDDGKKNTYVNVNNTVITYLKECALEKEKQLDDENNKKSSYIYSYSFKDLDYYLRSNISDPYTLEKAILWSHTARDYNSKYWLLNMYSQSYRYYYDIYTTNDGFNDVIFTYSDNNPGVVCLRTLDSQRVDYPIDCNWKGNSDEDAVSLITDATYYYINCPANIITDLNDYDHNLWRKLILISYDHEPIYISDEPLSSSNYYSVGEGVGLVDSDNNTISYSKDSLYTMPTYEQVKEFATTQGGTDNTMIINYVKEYQNDPNNKPTYNEPSGDSGNTSGGGSAGGDSGNTSGGGSSVGIFDFLGSIGESLGNLIKNIGNLVADVLKAITDVIGDITDNIPTQLTTFFSSAIAWIPAEIWALIKLSIVLGLVGLLVRKVFG